MEKFNDDIITDWDGTKEIRDGKADAHIKQILIMMDALKEMADNARAEGKIGPDNIDWDTLAYITGNIHENVLSMKAYIDQKQKDAEHKSK